MIIRPLALDAFRVLTPDWSHQPLSGAGAAREGGRFNRPAVQAVYLSLDPETALAEYRQTAHALEPGTIAQYRIELPSAVDFSSGYSPGGAWDALWSEWDCDWKELAFIQNVDPPTWFMADEVVGASHSALLFPSTKRPGGTNVVVYTALVQVDGQFQVHDPNGRLPRDQASWRPPA